MYQFTRHIFQMHMHFSTLKSHCHVSMATISDMICYSVFSFFWLPLIYGQWFLQWLCMFLFNIDLKFFCCFNITCICPVIQISQEKSGFKSSECGDKGFSVLCERKRSENVLLSHSRTINAVRSIAPSYCNQCR